MECRSGVSTGRRHPEHLVLNLRTGDRAAGPWHEREREKWRVVKMGARGMQGTVPRRTGGIRGAPGHEAT